MTILNCYSTSCLNNKRGVCTSSTVKLQLSNEAQQNNERIYCNNYDKSNVVGRVFNEINNLNLFNAAQEYNNISNHITAVNCSAGDCIYNKNGYCSEEKINLKDDESINKTYCNNYIKAY